MEKFLKESSKGLLKKKSFQQLQKKIFSNFRWNLLKSLKINPFRIFKKNFLLHSWGNHWISFWRNLGKKPSRNSRWKIFKNSKRRISGKIVEKEILQKSMQKFLDKFVMKFVKTSPQQLHEKFFKGVLKNPWSYFWNNFPKKKNLEESPKNPWGSLKEFINNVLKKFREKFHKEL